ncbi:MAG: ribosomal protein [Candidatus Parcubacteria bacterium]|jgi:large subunit ribosomal protein L6
MSKIGQKSIQVPASVQVVVTDKVLSVKGSKGELTVALPEQITIRREADIMHVERDGDNKRAKSFHGLFRSIIANAVAGVETHWTKRLEIVGTGYNVKLQGQDLLLKVGYSHPVIFTKPEGITFQVEGSNKIVVMGSDKQLVGQVANQIKTVKKPDAYKGKGIRFEGEKIRIKPGKKAKTG